MRFEIKGGGIAAIFLAVTVLSCAVFVLGLLAGYDVGRQSQLDAAQLATSYPLQTPPMAASNGPEAAAASAPAPKPSLEADASSSAEPPMRESQARSAEAGTAATVASPKVRISRTAAIPPRQRIASATIPPAAPPRSAALPPPAEDDTANAEPESYNAGDDVNQGAPLTAGNQFRRHKPYNIQIQAAMDINGADQMIARLRKLGYPSHLVPTEISGQRWYKVEVGPYATAEEASAAETALRRGYDAAYGGVARRNPAGEEATAGDSEE
jgi:septal ring-binding cell division protein DamX